jgi:hypothetical protein
MIYRKSWLMIAAQDEARRLNTAKSGWFCDQQTDLWSAKMVFSGSKGMETN